MKSFFTACMLLLIYGCVPLSPTGSSYGEKTLQLQDQTYEPEVKTVILTPLLNSPQVTLLPSVAKIDQQNLVLQFDDLRPDRDSYYARIVHCNYDWTRSGLQDLDFLTDFNEFPIVDFEFSIDTHIPFVHYRLPLPMVKLPGNYVVIVYRGSNKDDVIISKRFMVYDSQISLSPDNSLIGAGAVARRNQQINFTVSYPNIEVINPMESINVSIRQNQRWDNIATNIKPSFVREIEKELEYRFFDETNMLSGGNEFRFFDIRSLIYPGRNVGTVDRTTKPYVVNLAPDRTRQLEAYSQYDDLNGNYILQNLDFNSNAYSHYAYVNFHLQSKPLTSDVYVIGSFNYWNLNNDNKMKYDSSRQEYVMTALLKQGWYDYQYLVKGKGAKPTLLEGSHFETENDYEILVYYRPFRPNADLLVGYVRVTKNAR